MAATTSRMVQWLCVIVALLTEGWEALVQWN